MIETVRVGWGGVQGRLGVDTRRVTHHHHHCQALALPHLPGARLMRVMSAASASAASSSPPAGAARDPRPGVDVGFRRRAGASPAGGRTGSSKQRPGTPALVLQPPKMCAWQPLPPPHAAPLHPALPPPLLTPACKPATNPPTTNPPSHGTQHTHPPVARRCRLASRRAPHPLAAPAVVWRSPPTPCGAQTADTWTAGVGFVPGEGQVCGRVHLCAPSMLLLQ